MLKINAVAVGIFSLRAENISRSNLDLSGGTYMFVLTKSHTRADWQSVSAAPFGNFKMAGMARKTTDVKAHFSLVLKIEKKGNGYIGQNKSKQTKKMFFRTYFHYYCFKKNFIESMNGVLCKVERRKTIRPGDTFLRGSIYSFDSRCCTDSFWCTRIQQKNACLETHVSSEPALSSFQKVRWQTQGQWRWRKEQRQNWGKAALPSWETACYRNRKCETIP